MLSVPDTSRPRGGLQSDDNDRGFARVRHHILENALMVIPVVGVLLAASAGALTSAVLAALFRLMRLGMIGAPVIGLAIGGGSSVALQLLGGGALQFLPETGMIDWPPVIATMGGGAACAAIASFCILLMRLGGRAHPVLARRPRRARRFRTRRVSPRRPPPTGRATRRPAPRRERPPETLAVIAGSRD